MSKNLALLALATAAFCSVSVHANPEAQCRAALGSSKHKPSRAVIDKRCACVKARHQHHHENFQAANEHCKDNNDNPA